MNIRDKIRANEIEIAYLRREAKANAEAQTALVQAARVREGLSEFLRPRPTALSHTHYCRHCDVGLPCDLAGCPLPLDISQTHKCGERQDYLARMRRLLGQRDCKWKCPGECSHPRKDPYVPRQDDDWEYMRPKVEPVKIVSNPVIMAGSAHSDECVCNECKRNFRKSA